MSEFIFYLIFLVAFCILAYMVIRHEYDEKPFAKKAKAELIVLTIIIVLSGVVMAYDESHVHNESMDHNTEINR